MKGKIRAATSKGLAAVVIAGTLPVVTLLHAAPADARIKRTHRQVQTAAFKMPLNPKPRVTLSTPLMENYLEGTPLPEVGYRFEAVAYIQIQLTGSLVFPSTAEEALIGLGFSGKTYQIVKNTPQLLELAACRSPEHIPSLILTLKSRQFKPSLGKSGISIRVKDLHGEWDASQNVDARFEYHPIPVAKLWTPTTEVDHGQDVTIFWEGKGDLAYLIDPRGNRTAVALQGSMRVAGNQATGYKFETQNKMGHKDAAVLYVGIRPPQILPAKALPPSQIAFNVVDNPSMDGLDNTFDFIRPTIGVDIPVSQEGSIVGRVSGMGSSRSYDEPKGLQYFNANAGLMAGYSHSFLGCTNIGAGLSVNAEPTEMPWAWADTPLRMHLLAAGLLPGEMTDWIFRGSEFRFQGEIHAGLLYPAAEPALPAFSDAYLEGFAAFLLPINATDGALKFGPMVGTHGSIRYDPKELMEQKIQGIYGAELRYGKSIYNAYIRGGLAPSTDPNVNVNNIYGGAGLSRQF